VPLAVPAVSMPAVSMSAVNMSLRTGLTLIEIIVVLLILVLITSLGVPLLRGRLAQQELQHSADRIRAEWLDAQVRAKEEGQILCMRVRLGGSTVRIDRLLDTHYTAGLSTRQTTSRFDVYGEYDPFERGGFTGTMQDFILPPPDDLTESVDTLIIELPSSVIAADVIAVADERAAFYLGMTAPEGRGAEEIYGIEAIMTGDVWLGEMPSADGKAWSTPIFFYPDGSSSTAAILLKNDSGRCIEVRLRGLTGTGMVMPIALTADYTGELDAQRF